MDTGRKERKNARRPDGALLMAWQDQQKAFTPHKQCTKNEYKRASAKQQCTTRATKIRKQGATAKQHKIENVKASAYERDQQPRQGRRLLAHASADPDTIQSHVLIATVPPIASALCNSLLFQNSDQLEKTESVGGAVDGCELGDMKASLASSQYRAPS